MKMKQIALLLAGLSTSALAMAAPVTVAQIDTARTNGTLQQAWISGASAPTRTVYEGWVRGCDADTNTIFSTQSGNASVPGAIGNFSAYACTRGGRVSILYHTLDGGSLNFVTPHTVGTVLARVKFPGSINGGNGCTSQVNYVDPTNAANNALVFKGCTQIGAAVPATGATAQGNIDNTNALATDQNAPQWPVGGFSDVEAELFDSTIGGGDVSARGVQSDVGAGQVFGVAASVPLYRAMQAAQGKVQNDDPVNAPSITKSQYVALAASGGAMNGDWTPLLGNNPGKVRIQRRVDTSGTQASSNAYFLQNPCSTAIGASLLPATPGDNIPGAYEVTLNSGSGNVKSALTSATNNPTATERYAIGVLSLENNWRLDPAASAGYRFLAIEGVHPELGDTADARATATAGLYTFHMELKNFVRDNYAGKPAKTAFEAAVIPAITQALQNPPASSCAVYPRGLTLNPLNGSSCTPGVQVAKVTNLGKNCSPAQVVLP